MITESVEVYRGDTDKYGNPTKALHGTVSGVFAWGTGSSSYRAFPDRAGKRESTRAIADLYVPRGTDLKTRDRVKRANGDEYAVVGRPLWDQPHPMTGHNFSWMVFQVEAISG
ncbi:hypothetical protein JF710_26105 [Mycobacterium intracellulare]|jgi:hypothetical protein|uniref:hypothetical protein n=1 Tax=Mycobacterium intracellulare TaxID=1767 RepID=UPI001CDAD8CF|nr:hypothetical protein [Mycobacterium intracellulare]MCA2256664.1 hypothetical protein [Mycobacterium intracellulare]